MPIIEFLKTSDNTYKEVSATNPLPTTATISAGSAVIGHVITDSGSVTTLTGSNFEAADGAALPSKGVQLIVRGAGSLSRTLASGDSFADADDGQRSMRTVFGVYNGATWDKQRNNTQNTLLASAARTVTTSSADQTNYNASGATIVVDVTVIPSGSLTVTISGKDALSGKYFTLLTGAAITTVSTNVYQVYPALTAVANLVANNVIPRTYRVTVTAGDATSITYSVASLLNL